MAEGRQYAYDKAAGTLRRAVEILELELSSQHTATHKARLELIATYDLMGDAQGASSVRTTIKMAQVL